MKGEFLYHDLFQGRKKNILNSTVEPLKCYICQKELNGISITAKILDGKPIFLCSYHFQTKPSRIEFVK